MLNKIINLFYRKPDFIISSELDVPYLLRWYIIPRNNYFNIYLHKFLRDDDDRALHDHPWKSLSFLVYGQYIEHTDKHKRKFSSPSVIYREAEYKHRIELIDRKPAWTIFFTGPKVRDWGFHCPKGWIPWWEFVKGSNRGQVGKGCGEH